MQFKSLRDYTLVSADLFFTLVFITLVFIWELVLDLGFCVLLKQLTHQLTEKWNNSIHEKICYCILKNMLNV